MKYKDMKLKESYRFDLQRRIVSHMTSLSWRNIPHVSYIYEPDITDFYNEFTKLAKERIRTGSKISFNTIMIKVIIEGLLKAPNLNSHIEYNHNKSEGLLRILEDINISIPWLLPDGRMITPTVLNAEKMSLNDISNYIINLSRRIEKTNIDELLYRVVLTDTVNELKKFNLSILKRIFQAKISKHRIKGLGGKEKEDYYKIPENERLTEKISYPAQLHFQISDLYIKNSGGSLACLKSYRLKFLPSDSVLFRKNQPFIYSKMELRKSA